MKQYIGTKLIQAEPAFRVDGNIYLETWPCPTIERTEEREDGYKVVYPDGYASWSPKAVFEAAYLPVTVNSKLRTEAPSISQEMVDDFIKETEVITMGDMDDFIKESEVITMGDKTTVVRAVLRNGFEIVESSACVSAENYDESLGAEICMEHIKNKVWMLLGFLLQTAVHGIQ